MRASLNCAFPFFVRADAQGFLDVGDEDLAVADLASLGGFDNRGDCGVQALIADDHLELYLRQEIHRVFAAPINLRVPLLPTEALDFADRHSFNPHLRQGVFDFFQLERLDDGFDLFHIGIRHVKRRGAPAIPAGRSKTLAHPRSSTADFTRALSSDDRLSSGDASLVLRRTHERKGLILCGTLLSRLFTGEAEGVAICTARQISASAIKTCERWISPDRKSTRLNSSHRCI